MMDQQQK